VERRRGSRSSGSVGSAGRIRRGSAESRELALRDPRQ
jgi:hypothetical protein